MKQEFKIISLLFLVSIVLCGIMVLQAAAQDAEGQRAVRDTAARSVDRPAQAPRETDRRPDQVQGNTDQGQLRQIDAEIERLRQMIREAEEIRANIARQAGQPQAQAPMRGQRPEAVQQAQPGTAARPGAPGQNVPVVPRPGARAVIDNIPQMIDQLRNALNNNVERIHNAYQRIQQRLTNLEEENQRLRDENRDLRNQNQQLRARLQEREPRIPTTGERATETVERP